MPAPTAPSSTRSAASPTFAPGACASSATPDARIAEDYLRILRFFRMTAWYGDPAGGLDADGLAACAAGQEGLDGLSRERVGAEVTKLLAAPDPAPAVAAMAATGILARVLPGADPAALAPLVHLEGGRAAALAAPPRRARLASRMGRRPASLPRRARALDAVAAALAAGEPPGRRRLPPRRRGRPRRRPRPRRLRRRRRLPPASTPSSPAAPPPPSRCAPPTSPSPARRSAPMLRRLEEAWIASDFALDAEALRLLAVGGRG